MRADVGRGRSFSLILVASLAATAPALAATREICEDLRGQLANVTETIGTRHEPRRSSGAVNQQNFEIHQLMNDMTEHGCASQGAVVSNAQDAAACDGMESTLAQMQENLRYLISKQGGGRDDNSEGATRERLQAALRDNGCEMPFSADVETFGNSEETPPTPAQQALRTDTFIPPLGQGGFQAPMSYPSGENLQTVCVRTCDGGFFPMTANATPLNFQHDASTCAQMCPGVQTELFYRYLPGQESSQMVSTATGAPYSAMPYAFAFRKRAPGEKSSCTCNLSAYYEEMRRDKAMTDPQSDTSPSSITTIQTQKPPPQPTVAAAPTPAKPAEERPYDPSTSKVRQVGPQFFDGAPGQIDLKHPADPGPQPLQQ